MVGVRWEKKVSCMVMVCSAWSGLVRCIKESKVEESDWKPGSHSICWSRR